jgi:hypothetical protein
MGRSDSVAMAVTAGSVGLDVLGGGVVGTVTGVALSAFDSFLLDRRSRAWKPTQFIGDHLRQLGDTQKAGTTLCRSRRALMRGLIVPEPLEPRGR